MTKTTVISIVAATGVIATAAPAAFLASSGSGQVKPETGPFIPKLTSATEIRNEYKKVKCLNGYFGNIKFNGSGKTQNPKFDGISNFSSDSKGCLIVEYYKETYTNEKWKGEFRLIWAVKDETQGQGLITVTNARTDTNKGELWGNSVAYTLKRNGNENSWITSNVQEIHESAKKTDVFLKKLIPQKSETLPGSLSTTNYWGFNPTLENICGKDNCKEVKDPETRNSYSWNFVGGNGDSAVHSWNSDIDNWLGNIFDWKGVKGKIQEVKGTWKENQFYTNSKEKQ